MEQASIRKVAGSIGWAGLEAVSSVLVSLVALLGIARLIGASEFGLGALALGIVQMLGVVLGSLFHDALVRSPRLGRQHFDSAWTATWLLSLVAVVVCLALAAPLAGFFREPRFALVFASLAIALLPEAASVSLIAERRREMDFRLVTVQFLVARGIGAVGGVGCALAGLGVWSMVAQQWLTSVLGLGIMLVSSPMRPRFRLSVADLTPMVRFTSSIVATQFVITFAQRLILIYVARTGDLTLAGYWGLADRLVDALQRTITNALYHVTLVHFARVQDQARRLGEVVRAANVWLASLVFPGLIVVAVTGPDIIDLLVGPTWLPAGPAVQVLALGVILQLRRLMDHVALNALGRSEVALLAYALETLLTMVALFTLSPATLFGIALIRAIQPAIGYLVIAARSIGMTGRHAAREALDLALDTAVVTTTGLAAWASHAALGDEGVVVILVVVSAVAITTAVVTTGVLRPATVRQAWSTLRAQSAAALARR